MGDRLTTGPTPGCPEVEEDNFPLQIGKGDFVVIKGLEGEVRSGDVDRLFLPFTALRKDPYPSQAQDEDDQEFEKGSFQANFLFS